MQRNEPRREFSEIHARAVYDSQMRCRKAKKIFAILNEYCGNQTDKLSVLDLGCSAGIISEYLSQRFARVTGIDIDRPAIEYALAKARADNLNFYVRNALETGFLDESFDIVICNHTYEHTADPGKLLKEIKRILKPGGVCYFAAENRLNIIEAHYKLPFLSYVPKPWAHLYLMLTKKGRFYCENLLTYWGLKRFISKFDFKVTDYTLKIINRPQEYGATELIRPGSVKQKILSKISKLAYWACPTYIWLLKK